MKNPLKHAYALNENFISVNMEKRQRPPLSFTPIDAGFTKNMMEYAVSMMQDATFGKLHVLETPLLRCNEKYYESLVQKQQRGMMRARSLSGIETSS